MSLENSSPLPPNPYSREPIKKITHLAGRKRELDTIKYYLNLTASGQSPHLAVIGPRGVGKTSLLNGAQSIAAELKLLPVRLDMNEQKASSPGRFWQDLYATLNLALAKANCWGGIQGPIYLALLKMIIGRQPSEPDMAVMQFPLALACHQGQLDELACPDALIVHDFASMINELECRGYSGLAILIDEADLIGRNVPLLQMFRNIFQVVERCSLVFAGTEAVFPALSEVFSPIPRQFHRIDVRPFPGRPQTMELVIGALQREGHSEVAPEPNVIADLHQLCGGDPAETQLYCHHMYRKVEEGLAKRMALTPEVFREVLGEYRANTTADAEVVLNAIERLSDELLYKSRWLSRRSLTLDENVAVEVLSRELELGKRLSEEDRDVIAARVRATYDTLFEAGIIENKTCVKLLGGPLTAGFWKSFVEVEKGKRWSWNDDAFSKHLSLPIVNAMVRECGIVDNLQVEPDDEAVEKLTAFRAGNDLSTHGDGWGSLIFAAVLGRLEHCEHAVQVSFQVESLAGRQRLLFQFLERKNRPLSLDALREWLVSRKEVLEGNRVSFEITSFDHWQLPSDDELKKLGEISGIQIPDLTITELAQGISSFKAGDIRGAAEAFQRMVKHGNSSSARNNLSFCQILLGELDEAHANATEALSKDYTPLYELNKGIAEYLLGKKENGVAALRHALQWLRDRKEDVTSRGALYVLILSTAAAKVESVPDVPVDVAILVNLWVMGDLSDQTLIEELEAGYGREFQKWIPMIEVRKRM